jgi:hypothetical protein
MDQPPLQEKIACGSAAKKNGRLFIFVTDCL